MMRLTLPTLVALGAAMLVAPAASAAGPGFAADPIYGSPMFNFEGFYAGVTLGGATVPGPGFVGSAGVVAGANFTLSESFLAGLEFQGDVLFNGGGALGVDALLLGHLGGFVTQDMMVYGAVGGGIVNGAASYAFGAGLELPLAAQISARAELLGTGTWGAMPNGARLTGGLLWHLN